MTLYVKFFPEDHTLKDFKYFLGLNIDTDEFNPNPVCGGGLHYTDFENMHNFNDFGSQIGFVTIPDGTPIVKIENGIYKSPQINIIEFMDFNEWLKDSTKHFEEKKCIKDPILYIRSNPDCSEDLKLEIVRQNGYAIKYIKNPTDEMKLAAVKNNGYAIECIEDPTDEMKLAAVKNNGYAIHYIKNPSEELKIEDVSQDGCYILY